jgi:hypothetical protein
MMNGINISVVFGGEYDGVGCLGWLEGVAERFIYIYLYLYCWGFWKEVVLKL